MVASSDVQPFVLPFWYLLRRDLTYERKSVLGSTHDTAPEPHGPFSRSFFTPVYERILAVLCKPCQKEKGQLIKPRHEQNYDYEELSAYISWLLAGRNYHRHFQRRPSSPKYLSQLQLRDTDREQSRHEW